MSKIINKKNLLILCLTVLILTVLLPMTAYAANFPGVVPGTTESKGSAKTDMNIKVDDSQLSFTAPTVINFAMRGDGTFIYPADDAAYLKNNSVMAIKVNKYVISYDPATKGFDDLTNVKDKNAYKLSVKTSVDSTVNHFSTSQSTLGSNWIMGKTGSSNATLGLRFTNGQMINVDDGIWGLTNGHALQSVVWYVSANLS